MTRRELWTLLLAVFGLVWVFPASMRNHLQQWKCKGLKKKKRTVWRLALGGIWKEHNLRIFKDEELSNQRLKDFFIQSLLEWSQDPLELENPSLLNFLDALYCG